jgi:predicted regulator of Ras-like GTPase activity (Roadblock/LC7/MglB family)
MDPLRTVPADFFADFVSRVKIDAAMLLRRNGRMLAAWSKAPVSWDVLAIMAATALGSMDTMLETLGSPNGQGMSVVASGYRFLFQKIEAQGLLVLIAKEVVPDSYLRETAKQLLRRLRASQHGEPPRIVTLGPNVR